MTRETLLTQIDAEFKTAAHAQSIGNYGMVRVCARRAAGVAIAYWLQSHHRQGWGADAMNQLRSLRNDDSIPQPVRDAAERLTTKITQQFTPAFTADPILDSKTIINHLLESL